MYHLFMYGKVIICEGIMIIYTQWTVPMDKTAENDLLGCLVSASHTHGMEWKWNTTQVTKPRFERWVTPETPPLPFSAPYKFLSPLLQPSSIHFSTPSLNLRWWWGVLLTHSAQLRSSLCHQISLGCVPHIFSYPDSRSVRGLRSRECITFWPDMFLTLYLTFITEIEWDD